MSELKDAAIFEKDTHIYIYIFASEKHSIYNGGMIVIPLPLLFFIHDL